MTTQFTSTVRLTFTLETALKRGSETLQRGQWVERNGERGQFIRADQKGVYVSWAKDGESFDDRTQRFARAVWHALHKHEPVTAVIHAPASVDMDRLKKHFETAFREKRAA